MRTSQLSRTLLVALVGWISFAQAGLADDWPMWRKDAGRTAKSAEKLPAELHLRWTRDLQPLTPAWRESRLQFDAGHEPIVQGKTMFVGSSRTHSVTAIDTETGKRRWEFFAEGAVRFAPVAWRDRVIFGADDGCVYCLSATTGKLQWRHRAVPSNRKVLANGEMISLWPVRGGPVVHQDKLYFAAGVWSFEGVFVFCLDPSSGKVHWRNDEGCFLYGTHPHAAEALGGITPQGYLVVSGDNLIVPCGQAMPAMFDLKTGKLKSFKLPRPGRRPGGWFASAAVRRGEVQLDASINRDLHEDKVYQGPGSPNIRTTIQAGDRKYRFSEALPGVEGKIHTMLAANGQLFVVTQLGRIYCFGAERGEPVRYPLLAVKARLQESVDQATLKALEHVEARNGFALVNDWLGTSQPLTKLVGIIDTLLTRTKFHLVVVVEKKPGRLASLQKTYRRYRDRLCLLSDRADLPEHFASLSLYDAGPQLPDIQALRPYGGVAALQQTPAEFADLAKQEYILDGGGKLEQRDGITLLRRGQLKGAANYIGGWSSPDELVRAPLGVLWFGDSIGHFKRSPQPWFVDGVMISYTKDWMARHRENRKPPYKLQPPVFTDVYTGRRLAPEDPIVQSLRRPLRDLRAKQPNQYRPPKQKDAWKPKQPIVGERLNPLTGVKEPRAIPKSYGCDGGVDYGHFYTMRSGTPAFYDKRLESGVCNISGPRSGCTNSIIPACGVLNVPYFYEGCTCSYPLPVGLTMVSKPPNHEQWASWGLGKADDIQRVGINFGAPGDRMTEAGTLWLDYPSRGGPSPAVKVSIEPKEATFFYQHSVFSHTGLGWPWVASSGVRGARTVKVGGIRKGTYTVILTSMVVNPQTGKRSDFDIQLNGGSPLAADPIKSLELNYARRIVQKVKIDGELTIQLKPRVGPTVLSGIEIVREGLKLDTFISRYFRSPQSPTGR